jgi:hypothetical protein
MSVRQTKPSLSTLQRLNGWLLVHTDHNSILGGLQVQSNDVSRLLGELRVGADTPTVAPLKVDTAISQYPPYVGRGNIPQLTCNQASGPTAVSRWRRGVQQGKNPAFRIPIVSWLLTRTRCILQSFKARLQEPLAPSYHHGTRQPNLLRYRIISLPIRCQQYQPRPLHLPVRSGPSANDLSQLLPLFTRKRNHVTGFAHATIIA